MLITIIVNLNMVGSVTPPTPPVPPEPIPQSALGYDEATLKQMERRKKIEEANQDIIIILAGWMTSKRDN